MLNSVVTPEVGNKIILTFECLSMAIGILMIIIGILQNKEFQAGLAALNGGNEELFSNSKERGKQKVLSTIMMSLGIALVVFVIIILILTNTILPSSTA